MRVESELVSQRNRELAAIFLNLLGDGRVAKDVMFSAACMPSSRFWISPENAQRYIKMRLAGSWGNKGNELTMGVRRIDAIIERCHGDFSYENIINVVESPAPCFFLERGSAINIIYNTLRERRTNKK